jgi:uncharacterized protein YbaP (TraB family)
MVAMIRKLLFLILATAALAPAYGQDKSLLYEVSGKGLAQPSYLYGTFHLVCPTDLQVSEATRKALTQAQRLYLELDLDDPTLLASMMTALALPGGKNAKDILSADDYAVLDAYLQKNMGVGLAQFGALKPVALQSMLVSVMLKCEPASYDMKFAEMAGQQGKEILGLETLQDQLAALDKLPIEKQFKELADMARKPEEARKEFVGLLDAYKAQDLTLLAKLMRESQFEEDAEQFDDEILNKRNANWIPTIEKAAKEKSTFFAFGAGHLIGPKGVISLLREKGYSVKVLP